MSEHSPMFEPFITSIHLAKKKYCFFGDACDRTATSRDGWLSFVTPSLNWKIQSEIKVDSRKKMNLPWSLVMNDSHSGQCPLIWNSLKLVSDELTLALVWAIHHEYPLQIHYFIFICYEERNSSLILCAYLSLHVRSTPHLCMWCHILESKI